MNVLVTGCGGDIGQSIGKILLENPTVNLFGCDISDKNAAQFIYPTFFISKPCSSNEYIAFLEDSIIKYDIDILIPMSEPELRFFSEHKIKNNLGKAKIVGASPLAVEIGLDKLKTANFLESYGLPFPQTQLIDNVTDLKLPVIFKSRTGSGSADVFLIESKDDYKFLTSKHKDFIVQEFIKLGEGEFTCGLFRSKKGEIRTIILKRQLTDSYSSYGEVIENPEIETLLLAIADKIDLVGSINVQLRITSKGPMVFEINPRFSSTVLFRHLFGFKDLVWSIEDALNEEVSNYIPVKAGRKFYKGFMEFIK